MPLPIRFTTLALVMAAGVACTVPEENDFPAVSFRHLPTIDMAVADTTVASTFQTFFNLPRVENEMPVLPENVLRNWARDRLVSTGEGQAALTFTVTDARVVVSDLKTDQTLKAWFTNEQAVRYTVSLSAVVSVDDPDLLSSGRAEAATQRSVIVPEDATLNERRQILFDLIVEAAGALDTALEENIGEHLAMWIR